MRINNIYLNNLPIGQAENRETEPPSRDDASTARPASSSHVPSAELTHVLDQVRQTPEIRPDLLAQIAQRLAQGYYLTSEASERAAEAILNAPE